jgi:hypothetical protein
MLHTAASSPILSAQAMDSVFTDTASGGGGGAAAAAPASAASSARQLSSSSSQLLSLPLAPEPPPPHLRWRRAWSLRNCLILSLAVRVRTKPTHCSCRRTMKGVTPAAASRRTSTTSPLERT